MTREPIEVTRQDRIYCLKVSSDYHSEVCEECRFYPNCDHMTQDDMTELTIKDLETLEQEPTTKENLVVDCISRADAIKAMQNKAKELKNEDTINGLCGAVAILFEMPSITPIRPKGHWIDTKENSTNTRGQIIHEVICSECNGIAYFRSIGNKYIGANTCPNCGAKMESEGI